MSNKFDDNTSSQIDTLSQDENALSVVDEIITPVEVLPPEDDIIWDDNALRAYKTGARDALVEVAPVVEQMVMSAREQALNEVLSEVGPALADGLRKRSPECARALVKMFRHHRPIERIERKVVERREIATEE